MLGGFGGFSLRVLLPTVLLVAGLFAIYSWQQEQCAADIEELDAQLLTDDLPIDAYLDRGFEAWLKKVSATRQRLMRAFLAAFLLLAFAGSAADAAPKDRGPQWASLTADQQQVLAPLAARVGQAQQAAQGASGSASPSAIRA